MLKGDVLGVVIKKKQLHSAEGLVPLNITYRCFRWARLYICSSITVASASAESIMLENIRENTICLNMNILLVTIP